MFSARWLHRGNGYPKDRKIFMWGSVLWSGGNSFFTMRLKF